jgi:hypothetical protein
MMAEYRVGASLTMSSLAYGAAAARLAACWLRRKRPEGLLHVDIHAIRSLDTPNQCSVRNRHWADRLPTCAAEREPSV